MAVNRERQMRSKAMESFDVRYSTLAYVRDQVARFIEQYGENATIDMQTFPYDDGEYPYVFAAVPETDGEMAERIAREELWEQQRLERDRREFERLSKQFADKK